jgi:hypothetical protein
MTSPIFCSTLFFSHLRGADILQQRVFLTRPLNVRRFLILNLPKVEHIVQGLCVDSLAVVVVGLASLHRMLEQGA